MATNLRLRRETEVALRAESERTGRSQQELIREALDQYLGAGSVRKFTSNPPRRSSLADLIPARVPYRRPHRFLDLPEGVTSLNLLDREDRI